MIPIPPWLFTKGALYAGIALAGFLAGMSTHKVFADRKYSALELLHQTQVAEWERKVADAERLARETEGRWQAEVDGQRGKLDEALARISENARTIARLRVDRDRLHYDLTTFASGSLAQDTIAACRARAERLAAEVADGAGLLDRGRELVIALAEDADRRGAKLKACVEAWPR